MKMELPPGIVFSVTTKRTPSPVMPKEFLDVGSALTSRGASSASGLRSRSMAAPVVRKKYALSPCWKQQIWPRVS